MSTVYKFIVPLKAYFFFWAGFFSNYAQAEFKPKIILHGPLKFSTENDSNNEMAKKFNIEACQDFLNKDYENRIQYELVLGSYFNKVPLQAFISELNNFNIEKSEVTEKEMLNSERRINEILKLYANAAIDNSRDDALREDIPKLRSVLKTNIECQENYLTCAMGFKEYAHYEALKSISAFQDEINRNLSASNAETLNKIDRWAFEQERQYKDAVDKKDLVRIETLRLTASHIRNFFTINENNLSDITFPLTKLSPQERESAVNRMKMMQDNIAASSPYKYIDKMSYELEKKIAPKNKDRLVPVPYTVPTK